MKIFKISILLLLFIQCGKHKDNPEPELEDYPNPCLLGPTIHVDTAFKEFETEMVHYYKDIDTAYFIRYKRTAIVNTGFLYPCSLPNEFRIDGLKVIVSGNIISNGKIQTKAADTFQLLSIKVKQ